MIKDNLLKILFPLTITGPVAGDVVRHDGVGWVNKTPSVLVVTGSRAIDPGDNSQVEQNNSGLMRFVQASIRFT